MAGVQSMASKSILPVTTGEYHTICSIPVSTVHNLKPGLNFITVNVAIDQRDTSKVVRLLVYRNDDQSLTVCRNLCRHNGGTFIHDIEDSAEIVKCTFHGWKLNTKTLNYTNPPDCLKQEQLKIEIQMDGSLTIFEPLRYEPWAVNEQQMQSLKSNELTITYISHACVEIQAAGMTLITDPWLTGPSFGRGWWLLHEPEADAYERVANANAIYISHGHPDHFNLPTLRRIAKMNPHVPIYVPRLKVNVFSNDLERLGFTNIQITQLGTWQTLSKNNESCARFMILPDHLFPHLDTFLLFEYKGHRILNLVDCCNPNGDHLPSPVDVLLTDFASGASGFPSCFVDQFGEDKVLEMAKTKAHTFLKKTTKHIQITKTPMWIPFAGYFMEAGPGDEQIQQLNWKNTPESAAITLQARIPHLQVWCPFPGGKYDVGSNTASTPSKTKVDYLKRSWNFEPYIRQLDESMKFKPLQTMDGVKEYFRWAEFKNYDLVLHIIETSNNYSTTIREYFVDFAGSAPVFPSYYPPGRPLFRIRGRSSVFRDTFIRGWSWDNIYIGFSGHFFAEPNTYHFKFWDHFNNSLPEYPPSWKG
ncbi:unnamed protein product, partial [Adineta steineri]